MRQMTGDSTNRTQQDKIMHAHGVEGIKTTSCRLGGTRPTHSNSIGAKPPHIQQLQLQQLRYSNKSHSLAASSRAKAKAAPTSKTASIAVRRTLLPGTTAAYS
jgi:hypothetical protein